jgi:hypothetical protein
MCDRLSCFLFEFRKKERKVKGVALESNKQGSDRMNQIR